MVAPSPPHSTNVPVPFPVVSSLQAAASLVPDIDDVEMNGNIAWFKCGIDEFKGPTQAMAIPITLVAQGPLKKAAVLNVATPMNTHLPIEQDNETLMKGRQEVWEMKMTW